MFTQRKNTFQMIVPRKMRNGFLPRRNPSCFCTSQSCATCYCTQHPPALTELSCVCTITKIQMHMYTITKIQLHRYKCICAQIYTNTNTPPASTAGAELCFGKNTSLQLITDAAEHNWVMQLNWDENYNLKPGFHN